MYICIYLYVCVYMYLFIFMWMDNKNRILANHMFSLSTIAVIMIRNSSIKT